MSFGHLNHGKSPLEVSGVTGQEADIVSFACAEAVTAGEWVDLDSSQTGEARTTTVVQGNGTGLCIGVALEPVSAATGTAGGALVRGWHWCGCGGHACSCRCGRSRQGCCKQCADCRCYGACCGYWWRRGRGGSCVHLPQVLKRGPRANFGAGIFGCSPLFLEETTWLFLVPDKGSQSLISSCSIQTLMRQQRQTTSREVLSFTASALRTQGRWRG